MFASGCTFGSGVTVDTVLYLLLALDAIVYLVVVLLDGPLAFDDILIASTIPIASAEMFVRRYVDKQAVAPRDCFVCGHSPFLVSIAPY